MKKIPAIHPGEILLEEFLQPMHISQYQLAKVIHVPQHRIYEIVKGKRSISADTALRLGKFFNMEPEFWLNLQVHYDLAHSYKKIQAEIDSIIHYKTVGESNR